MKNYPLAPGMMVSLVVMIVITQVSPVRANDLSERAAETCTWVRLGLGGRIPSGLAFGAGILQLRGKRLFTLSATISVKSEGEFMSTPEGEDWTIGLLYGQAWTSEMGLASASAGAGIVGGSREFKEENFGPTIAILGEAQLTFRPVGFFGLSLHGNTTLHPKGFFVAILLSLNIGKVK